MDRKEKYRQGLITVLLCLANMTSILAFLNRDFFNFLSEYILYVAFFIVSVIFFFIKKKLTRRQLILIGLFVILLVISMFKDVSGIGSYLTIVNTLIIMIIAGNANITIGQQKIVSLSVFLFYIILFIKSFNIWNEYTNGVAIANPNIVAQFLVLNACILYVSITKFVKNKCMKNLSQILLIVITLLGAIMCNSRTSILVVVSMAMILGIGVIKKIILRFYKIVGVALVVIGAVIPFAYVNLYNKGMVLDFSFNTDKRFYTGREKIWKYSIDELDYNEGYIWGLGTHHETSIGEISNFHNWYFGEIYYFGILMSLVLFLFVIERLSDIKSDEIKILALSVLIFGFFEMSLQWGFSQITFLPLLFLDSGNKQ